MRCTKGTRPIGKTLSIDDGEGMERDWRGKGYFYQRMGDIGVHGEEREQSVTSEINGGRIRG